MIKWVRGGITAPKGFKAGGTACGIKASKNMDLGVVLSDVPAKAVGVFTQNKIQSPTVVLNHKRLVSCPINGVVVNSGNANACTGKQGYIDAEAMAKQSERRFGLQSGTMLVCSTGVIGEKMPMAKIKKGIGGLLPHSTPAGSNDFASAILTTDTCTKSAAIETRIDGTMVRIGGACKGSGMIHPNLATMLAFFTTDLQIGKREAEAIFKNAVNGSFNRISVDGDASTNDTVLLLANGAAGNRRLTKKGLERFSHSLEAIMIKLARMIARDGEGATKLIDIKISGARSEKDAVTAAKSIANSPLVKTAMFGNDPNWGRIICAAGYSGAALNTDRLKLTLCGKILVRNGMPVKFNAPELRKKLKTKEVGLELNLGVGKHSATVWTCDLSYDYVRINADYHT